MPRLRHKSRSRHTTFFSRYDMQYIYDAVGIVAEQLHVLMDWENSYIRQIAYMANLAVKTREDKAKAAAAQAKGGR